MNENICVVCKLKRHISDFISEYLGGLRQQDNFCHVIQTFLPGCVSVWPSDIDMERRFCKKPL